MSHGRIQPHNKLLFIPSRRVISVRRVLIFWVEDWEKTSLCHHSTPLRGHGRESGASTSTARCLRVPRSVCLYLVTTRHRRKIESRLVLIVGIASLLLFNICLAATVHHGAHYCLTRLMNLIILSSLLQNRKVGRCSASLIGG